MFDNTFKLILLTLRTLFYDAIVTLILAFVAWLVYASHISPVFHTPGLSFIQCWGILMATSSVLRVIKRALTGTLLAGEDALIDSR